MIVSSHHIWFVDVFKACPAMFASKSCMMKNPINYYIRSIWVALLYLVLSCFPFLNLKMSHESSKTVAGHWMMKLKIGFLVSKWRLWNIGPIGLGHCIHSMVVCDKFKIRSARLQKFRDFLQTLMFSGWNPFSQSMSFINCRSFATPRKGTSKNGKSSE